LWVLAKGTLWHSVSQVGTLLRVAGAAGLEPATNPITTGLSPMHPHK